MEETKFSIPYVLQVILHTENEDYAFAIRESIQNLPRLGEMVTSFVNISSLSVNEPRSWITLDHVEVECIFGIHVSVISSTQEFNEFVSTFLGLMQARLGKIPIFRCQIKAFPTWPPPEIEWEGPSLRAFQEYVDEQ